MRSLLIFAVIVFAGIYAIVQFTPVPGSTIIPAITTTAVPVTFIPPGSSRARGVYSYASYQTSITEAGTNLCVELAGTSTCGPRKLDLGIYYPAVITHGNPVPYRGLDSLPLVIFAPGYNEYYSAYSTLLESLVSSGYVVIGVDFPLNDPSSPGGPEENDILNQPADMSSVISWALNQNVTKNSLLYQLINSKEIVATGQSDGGNTALALSYNTCCIDHRVAATVIFSGAELPTFPGTYFPAGQDIPLLVIQGTNDPINPPSVSQQIFAGAPSPKLYLSLIGQDHLSAYTVPGPFETIVAAVTTDFINGYVLHEPGYLSRLSEDGNIAGAANLTSSS